MVGADYLQKINTDKNKNGYLEMAVEIAKYHHENWDGTGYPEGLSGTDIPLSARIVAVIDTFMALNSERSSRDAYTREESVEIIKSEAGRRFDPDIIDIANRTPIVKQVLSTKKIEDLGWKGAFTAESGIRHTLDILQGK